VAHGRARTSTRLLRSSRKENKILLRPVYLWCVRSTRRLPSVPTFVWPRSTRATDRSASRVSRLLPLPTWQFEVIFQTRDGERRPGGCSFALPTPRTRPISLPHRARNQRPTISRHGDVPLVVSPVCWLGSVSAALGHLNGCVRLMMGSRSGNRHLS
jgi:hypothetical protein